MDGILRRGHLQPFFMGVTSRGLAFAAFFCGAGLVGCATDSFSSANDGGADAADAADATSTDARSDAPSGDTGTDANVCDCAPYWCGCGDCPTERIVCTRRHRTCSLQCLSSCTAIQLAVCTCEQGRCVRGGVGTVGCYVDEECAPGHSCCVVDAGVPGAEGTCAATCP